MTAMGVKVVVTQGQSGRLSEVKFMHHPGAPSFKSVMEKTLRGDGKETCLMVIDGIMIFSCDGKHVPATCEQEGALEELYKKIKCGRACLMPLQDGFFEGIVISVM